MKKSKIGTLKNTAYNDISKKIDFIDKHSENDNNMKFDHEEHILTKIN